MKFCKHCGAKVVPPAAFCEDCGARLAPPRPTQKLDAQPSFAPRSEHRAAIVAFIVIGLAWGGILAFSWLTQETPPSRKPSTAVSAERLGEDEEYKRRESPAYRLLAIQRDRNREVMTELELLRDRNDMAGFRSVLKSRAAELNLVIAAVEADYETYSIEEKRNVLKALTQERDWALSSYGGLQSLE